MNDSNDERGTAPPSAKTFREIFGGQSAKVPPPADPNVSYVVLGQGCARLPERLLLEHGQGKVLFLAGAGVSMPRPACLPSFRDLVLEVYRRLKDPLLPFLEACACRKTELPRVPRLAAHQKAEVKNFKENQLDVVLGMLERRIDGEHREDSQVRRAVLDVLQPDPPPSHASIHRDLVRLSSRGETAAILTTNFDLLLEEATEKMGRRLESRALGAMLQRPSFAGVLHLHGALGPEGSAIPDMILTDQDFGEFYFRRRVVPDLLYDAARIYHLILVGYTVGDPPVRYLLDAISADDARFPDLKERFIFVPCKGEEADEVTLADWRGRGLTPIPYSSAENHRQLAVTLEMWADLFEKSESLGDGDETVTERRVRETLEQITEAPLSEASDEDRGLFDHLIRREVHTRRAQLASHLGGLRRDYQWLDRILEVIRGRIEDGVQQTRPQDQPSGEVEQGPSTASEPSAVHAPIRSWPVPQAGRASVLDRASRRGLRRLLFRRANWEEALAEPWLTAWQLVQESWRLLPYADLDEARTGSFEINRRLERDDRSFALAEKMAEFVAAGVQLSDPWERMDVRGSEDAEPTSWTDLFRAELRSVPMSEIRRLDLSGIEEPEFLSCLIRALEAAVRRGLDLGRWIGWRKDFAILGLGWQQRVYFVSGRTGDTVEGVAGGIAASVKLLHAAVERLGEVDLAAASKLVRYWLRTECPVHRRLWAALARDGRLVSPAALKEVLLHSEDREFWLALSYPEFAELRALRFGGLDSETQAQLLDRLRRGPSSDLWAPDANRERTNALGVEIAVREMNRIQEAGGVLPTETSEWLDARLAELPDLAAGGEEHGFIHEEVGRESVQPDRDLDRYSGGPLLAQLEQRLASEEPLYGGSAGAWLTSEAPQVLAAMKEEAGRGLDYPHVWRALGWQHVSPEDDRPGGSTRDATAEATTVLELVATLTDATLAEAIEAVVRWWGNWAERIQPGSLARQVWLRLWPHAVAVTNARSGESSLEVAMGNTPAGVLARDVGQLAPELCEEERLSQDAEFGEILAAIVEAPGRAGLVALAWLVCDVGWYLQVDQPWAERYLVQALKDRSESAITLWDALCRLGLRGAVPAVLVGDAMELVEWTDDSKLSAWSRQRLLSKFVWDALRAFFHGREPVVEALQLRQLLSRLDGEMRSWCAMELWRCLVNRGDDSPSPDDVFSKAVAPFLEQVWPQERNLVSKGVSRSMAGIPAASRGEFVAAVEAVERFLVPGSATSRHDYGLYGEEDDKQVLEIIVDSPEKAEALLRLLDLTITSEEGVMTPLGLDELLARIREVAPELVERPEFARLTTMAKRSRFE